MAAHSDVVFQIVGGDVVRDEDDWGDDEDQDDWGEDEDHGKAPESQRRAGGEESEFKDCADGWYWQHRRIRACEDMGEAFGPLRGPFETEEEAEHDRKVNGATYGCMRL
jgi:hypothetical protein